MEAVQEVAKLAGGEVKAEQYALSIIPKGAGEWIFTVEYLMPPNYMNQVTPADSRAEGTKPKDWLMASGVTFGPTVSAIYIPSSHKLIVRNIMEEHTRVAAITDAAWKEYYESDEWKQEVARQEQRRRAKGK